MLGGRELGIFGGWCGKSYSFGDGGDVLGWKRWVSDIELRS